MSEGAGAARAPSAEELLRRLDATAGLKEREKPFEMAMSVANLYLTHGRFADAAEYFRQAWQTASALRAQAKEARAGSCSRPASPLASLVEALPSLTPAEKAACLHAGLELAAEAAEGRAAALFLAGDSGRALEATAELLQVRPDSVEGLFTRASILLETRGDDLAALRRARADLELLARRPDVHRRKARAEVLLTRVAQAIEAGGVSKLAAKRVAARGKSPPPPALPGPGAPALSEETVRAFQNVERTPELEEKLAGLIEEGEQQLVRNDYQGALEKYRQVMPLDPENGRVRAGLAWSLIGLKRPTADRIWSVAVESDPAAVEMLGHALEAGGNPASARQLWQRLAASAPDYARRTGLMDRLD